MELLIWYGADINAQNTAGNAPLHICCVHEQEAAAIVLLRRGANRELANNQNHTPCHIAVIYGNKNLANRIHEHVDKEVVRFSDRPSYNPRARPVSQLYQLCVIKKSAGNPTMSKSKQDLTQLSETGGNSKFGSLKRSMFRSASKKSLIGGGRIRMRPVSKGKSYVVTRNFTPQLKDDLTLTVGDNVEVLYIGREGFIEGICNGKQGWFAGNCVEQAKDSETENKAEKQKVQEIKPKKIKIKKSSKGFGFSIRGATSDNINFHPNPLVPSLHYVAQIDEGGSAEKAGLEVGHFILMINTQNVITSSHNEVVELVRTTKKVLEIMVTRSLRTFSSESISKNQPTLQKPVVPPRMRPVQKVQSAESRSADSIHELGDTKLRSSTSPTYRDERRLGHVNPLFFVQEEPEGSATPPKIKSRHEYATVRKEGKIDDKKSRISNEGQAYLRAQRNYDEMQSRSDTALTTRRSEETCMPRSSVGGSVELSYNESSSSNADMRTDSKVSDFTIESGYFYNSQGELIADAQLGPETAITKTNSVYVDDDLGAEAVEPYEYSDNKPQENMDYHSQDYFATFSNASLENNKADSTFDDEGEFTPFERIQTTEEPPYDTLDRKHLFYSGFEGEETYDHLNFNPNYYSNTPSDGDTLEGELADSYDGDQYEQLQTEEEFYHMMGKNGSSEELTAGNYEMEGGELPNYNDESPVEAFVSTDNEEVKENVVVEDDKDDLSQFAKAVLEKSLTLKRRRSGQTESNSASETGSNLSLKNSESDKKQESLTSDLGTDISSTFDTDTTMQQALLNTLSSPAHEPPLLSADPIVLQDKQGGDEEWLLEPPKIEHEVPDTSLLEPATEYEARFYGSEKVGEVELRGTSRTVQDPVVRESGSPVMGTWLDERNPKHWKHMLKKVQRQAPSKPDEDCAFVSRQLSASESKSCDNLYPYSAVQSSSPVPDRMMYILEEEKRFASRIPSIYTQERLNDSEDQNSYWKDQLNTSQSGKKKSNSDSELNKLASKRDEVTITLPPENEPPPLPNYSTFPGDLQQDDVVEDTPSSFEPYTDFTPIPIDIIDETDAPDDPLQVYTPPFDYLQGVPSPPSSRLILETNSPLMSPPEEFDSTDPIDALLPPPPIVNKSFIDDDFLPPPPSSLELKSMRDQKDVAPPDEILYRMDLKHSRRFKKPEEWSTDEVGDWLESFSMEGYRETFIENDIQGSHLQLLNKEDLTALGITKLGHKMTILKEISKLHF